MRNVLTRRAMAGLGLSAMAAAIMVGLPSAANALPDIEVTRTLNFGQVAVGDSRELDLTIKNNGDPMVSEDTAYSFSAISAPPQDSQFSVVQPFCFPADLPGGQTACAQPLRVRFTPSSTGAATDTVNVLLNYQQDIDPGPGTNLQFVQKQVSVTLVGNVLCAGRTPTVFGTPGDDEISGTAGDDVIAGLSGDDEISGLGGNDIVCGGSGSDVLKGRSGNDKLKGQSGSDVLKGGTGVDVCRGGSGIDRAAKCEKVATL
jgi:hypothetical protein